MKKLVCFSVVVILSTLFTSQAQSDEYSKWWKIVEEKNQSIQNGKIEMDYSYRRKDSTNFITKPFTMIYSKEISYKKKWRKVQKRYNVFDEKDSIQYICNSDILVTIYHKNKTYEVDTLKYIPFYAYYLPRMANFYLENSYSTFFVEENLSKKLFKEDNSIIFSYNARPSFGGGMTSDAYKDSIRKILDTKKLPKKQRSNLFLKMREVKYDYYYEFPLHDTVLTFLVEKVEDERIIHEYSSAEQKSILTQYDFNNPIYNSDSLYNYKNYIQNYEYVLSYNQQLEANKAKLLNKPAPAFELPVVGKDKTAKLEDYKGKWVLLDFWFIACKPCMVLMPEIEKLYQNYHSKGLEILGINIDKNDERLQNFVKEKNMPYLTLNTVDRAVSKLYGVSGYPTLILINPQQEVIVYKGSINEIELFLKKNLK
jgi:peroxiredoxin